MNVSINSLQPLMKVDNIAAKNRVFVNRNLRFEHITHMGFDMDHTLAVYNHELEILAYNLTRDRLVDEFGYPEECKAIEYKIGSVVRGLIIDKRKGNLIKLDQHKYVEDAYHGTRELNKEERKAIYNLPGERYRPDSEDYRYLDTLFCLPEARLFMVLVDVVDMHPEFKRAYKDIAHDIRVAIDSVHQDGSLKTVISQNLDFYIERDPMLPWVLYHFIQGHKKLFLLTNSEYYYTDIVMTYLLNGVVPGMESWQDYFEMIVVSARKPGFFLKEAPMEKISEDEKGQALDAQIASRVYRGGYFRELEKEIGSSGERILYFGDHTFGDILKSKQKCGWRTAMIIAEMEMEIEVLLSQKKDKRFLETLRQELQESEDDTDMLLQQTYYLRSRKIDNYEDFSEADLQSIDAQLNEIHQKISKNEEKITGQLKQIKELEVGLAQGYNPYWGSVFKSNRRKSRFGDQVEDHACVYTSRVTNFANYPTTKYFRIQPDLMPHERG